ncbi:hypothetical protein [Bradyrhizobium guangzhouense]|uniref:hypothetical protein n=1 Tax=Bradyrhizobium guangzhouense TaxID=1325095 RepID=UPI001009AE4F|nr:hypothetical protein [Bradyrhizobium guangzhouense]RXH10129.1 hypothetical protein EAS54_32285 [Bradyrhizobium guangzhouense]
MTSGPVQRSSKDVAALHPEVEFALVLARTIEAVKSDPQQLRSAIYELARQKLQQLAEDDPSQKERLSRALEVAIAGVEAHTTNNAPEMFPLTSGRPELARPLREPIPLPRARDLDVDLDTGAAVSAPFLANGPSRLGRWRWSSSTALRYVAMLVFFLGLAFLLLAQKRGLDVAGVRQAAAHLWSWAPRPAESPVPASKPAPLAQVAPAEPARPAWLPTAFGVYAEMGGKLYELQMLPGRAPDPRVAVSAAILKPSETTLPDGHLRFIVFRRDMSGAAEPVDVRVVARVKQVSSFDSSGKPVISSGEESWVIRNILMPYRTAPLKEDPQMYEILPRDPDAPLSPGRYALVIKNQAFDFTVEGAITDKRQCLERLSAANGVFFSECQSP